MIKTDLEFEITKERLNEFQTAFSELKLSEYYQSLPPVFQDIQKTAIVSQIEELKEQLTEYQAFKNQEVKIDYLEFELADLPMLLVKSRISRNLSVDELARKSGVRKEKIKELERDNYNTANLNQIYKIAKELGFKLEDLNRNVLEIKRNIKSSGIDPKVLKLIDSTRTVEGDSRDVKFLKFLTKLKRIFGMSLDSLMSGQSEVLSSANLNSVRYKISRNANGIYTSSYTQVVYYLAEIILRLYNKEQSNEILTDPRLFRNAVEEKYGEFSYENCLNYIWDLGIPVLPLSDSGAFHGASWRIKGRNILVLKQKNASKSRWLFDLLHEYWHATQEPDLQERSIIEEAANSPSRLENQEEKDANNFSAEVILMGKTQSLLNECVTKAHNEIAYMKSSVMEVAERNKVDVGALANIMAHELSKEGYNWWGAANNLQNKSEDPCQIAKEIFKERITISNELENIDKELLLEFIN